MMKELDWKKNKHVIIPHGTRLRERMFQFNNIVETITLPDDIDYLPDYFCFGCKRLKAILGGKNIKMVSVTSFQDCPQLYHLDFIPQIGYKSYDWHTKTFSEKYIRKLESKDFDTLHAKRKFGYILYRQDNEYLIWSVSDRRYMYAIICDSLPLYSYVSFLHKSIITCDVINNHLSIERNLVYDVKLASDEDPERFIYNNDIKAYIDGQFPYIKKIELMKTTIQNYIGSLNINKILDSYFISTDEHIRSKVGDDDTYTLKEYACSEANSSDIYLAKMLPSYSIEKRESSYCTFAGMTREERESYKEKERNVKSEAKLNYSAEEHFLSLIDAYIKYLYLKTNIYQEVLDAKKFLDKNREIVFVKNAFWEEFEDTNYWKEISEFTFELNMKYHLQKESCSFC